MTRCPDCDATVDPAASYCGNCGASLDGAASDATDGTAGNRGDEPETLELTDPTAGETEQSRSDAGEADSTEDVATVDGVGDLENSVDAEDVEDLAEMEELLELKRRHESQRIAAERERLQARDDVDPTTLATLEETDATLAEMARIAEDDVSEQRLRDQEAFREELRETMEASMDRMERLTERSIEELGDSGDAATDEQSGGGRASAGTVTCPNCERDQQAANDFCANCGRLLE